MMDTREYLSIPVPDIKCEAVKLAAMLREVLDESKASDADKVGVLTFLKLSLENKQ